MNIVTVQYRFLRLSDNLLALVELFENKTPEPTTCLYPKFPYMSENRQKIIKYLQGEETFKEWLIDCQYSFELAVEEAKRFPILDYSTKSRKDRDVYLWNYLNPLEDIQWDEYCPLFDSNFNLVLRNK